MKTLIFTVIVLEVLFILCELSDHHSSSLIENIERPPSKSLQNIFSSLPSEEDLQQIIYSADPFALTKLIQIIEAKNEEIACDALIVYSDALIGIIKTVKHSKITLLDQFNVVSEATKTEITRIKTEIKRINDQKDQLSLNKIRNEILNFVLDLSNIYNAVKVQSSKVESFSAQIAGYKKDISNRRVQSSKHKRNLLGIKLEVSGLDSQINQLERRLANIKQQRMTAFKDAEKIQETLANHSKQISRSSQKINDLQLAIQEANGNIDRNQVKAAHLEVTLSRMRSDLYINIRKEPELTNQLEQLYRELDIEQNKLLQREHEALMNMIKVWDIFLPKFQRQNSQLYYYCFGGGSIEYLKTGNVEVYIVNGVNLPNYIFNNYRLSLSQSTNIQRSVQFMVTNIFGMTWQTKYGLPFYNTTLDNGSIYLEQDFTCFNPAQVHSGKGRIKQIRNRFILIENDDANIIELIIGACSRIEAVTVVPELGQTIYYKGIYNKNTNNVNLYTGLCL